MKKLNVKAIGAGTAAALLMQRSATNFIKPVKAKDRTAQKKKIIIGTIAAVVAIIIITIYAIRNGESN